MHLAFCADVHVGNHKRNGGSFDAGLNKRCREHLHALELAVAEARHDQAVLVILGDLFDCSRPEPAVIAAVQNIIKNVQTIVLTGNHDCDSTSSGDNACAPLAPIAIVVDQPRVVTAGKFDIWCIPHAPGKFSDYLPATLTKLALEGLPNQHKILAFHAGIIHEKTPKFLQDSTGAVTVDELLAHMRSYGIVAAYAGDWHIPYTWQHDELIVQAGALVPTGWTDPGWNYGHIHFLHESDVQNNRISRTKSVQISGPRFLTSLSDIKQLSSEHTPYVRLQVPPDELRDTVEATRELPGTYEILPDIALAKGQARSAALAACQAETLVQALTDYVAAYPMPPDVTPTEVTNFVRYYLEV